MRQGNFGSKCKALLVLHKTLCFNQKISIEDTLFPNLEVFNFAKSVAFRTVQRYWFQISL